MMPQGAHGLEVDSQLLVLGSKMIHADDDLELMSIDGIHDHSSIHVLSRVRGGKPVKVKMMTNHLPCGSEVTIDIDEGATKDEIKMKLVEKTGVPFEHQKVMLSGINQIVMGDKRYVFPSVNHLGYSEYRSKSDVVIRLVTLLQDKYWIQFLWSYEWSPIGSRAQQVKLTWRARL